MIKFNNKRIAEFDRRITHTVLMETSKEYEARFENRNHEHDRYNNTIPINDRFKPCGLLRNSKLIAASFSESAMKRLLKRKGIVKPYISPYGNGVLPLSEDTAKKLSEQYGDYDILLKYNVSEEKEVEVIYELDKEPTFNTGMVVAIDTALITRWMEEHVTAINDSVSNATSPIAQRNTKYFVVAELYARYKSTSARVRKTMENITKMNGGDPTNKKSLKTTAREIVNYNKNTLFLLSSLELQLYEFKTVINEKYDIDTLDKIVKNFIKEVLEVNEIIH